ncbi:PepSY domain-containing protein [Hoyosella sp. YIM 151337]|uniref:PepSY-associated TM helix domain-containing protein n=1 Tax=Hoyosella sp. YIM 151337 TaxID=2992742 RepID=UPI0022364903|nr:PepSY domain-containing protein [Hoyosella sp. YIM 151337]MCW4355901.1 PepSY domain-containing protein [Hoyosella sp. YIM 151337]
MSLHDVQQTTVTAAEPSPKTTRTLPLRALILRLHFYAGILIAPFLLIATITGGLYALAPALEKVLYRDYLTVDSSGPALPLHEQVEAAQRSVPNLTVSAVRPAAAPERTTWVLFDDPELGESERRAVFINPGTAEATGESVVYGSSGALPMRAWISQLHRHLHLGDPGRIYSELAASWLWVVAFGGVYLWVARYRTERARNRETARLLTVDRGSAGRKRTLNWHGVAGVWIAAGLVFLSATGLTWSKYAGENIGDLRTAMSWTTPQLDRTLTGTDDVVAGGGHHHGHGGGSATDADPGVLTHSLENLDSVLATARNNDISGPVEIAIPGAADTAFSVTQTRQPWRFATSAVAVDGETGAVTDVNRFEDWPVAAKLTAWGISLHMGLLFGLSNQSALALLAAVLVTVIVRGYAMWWQRRPTRGNRRFGKAPARGGLRGVSPVVAVPLVVCAALVGWFVPLLGVSLLGFLAIDVLLGAVNRHETRRAESRRNVTSV